MKIEKCDWVQWRYMSYCNSCESNPCTCRASAGQSSSWLIIPCQGCHYAVIRVRAGEQREGMRCKWCEQGVKLAGRKA